MSRNTIVAVLVTATLLLAGALFVWTRNGDAPTYQAPATDSASARESIPTSATDSAFTDTILNVDQVAKNPAAFADRELRLMGVVSAVLPDQQLFAVIDEAEYASCKVVTCSQFQIPIAYAGELPAIETAVLVTGHLTQSEPGRYLLEATTLELPK